MTSTPSWEPPLAGTELEHLLGMLDRLRTTFRWKADGLTSEGLATRVGRSTLTLGGLLKHLAFVEDSVIFIRARGESPGGPWDPALWEQTPDWDFVSAADDSPTDLYELYDGTVARARQRLREILADGGLDQPAHLTDDTGNHPSLRRLLADLVEEYGRHTGHADLLREEVDGLVGEDPPGDWRPVS